MQVKALTLIFIAGAALAAGGLAYAQSQIVKGDPEPAMTQNSLRNRPTWSPCPLCMSWWPCSRGESARVAVDVGSVIVIPRVECVAV